MEKIIKIQYGDIDTNKFAKKVIKYCVDENGLDKKCLERLKKNEKKCHNLRITTDLNKECLYELGLKAIFRDIRITKKRVDILKANIESYQDELTTLDFECIDGDVHEDILIKLREIVLKDI